MMRRRQDFLAILLFVICPLFGTIIEVPTNYSAIQLAIDSAIDGDSVLVLPGTYYENIDATGKNITLCSMFSITQDTTYISQTIIDGSDNGSVICVQGGVLEGLTIQNGSSEEHGGGVYCSGGDQQVIVRCNVVNTPVLNRIQHEVS